MQEDDVDILAPELPPNFLGAIVPEVASFAM